ncbi:MAG: hypothetical protein KA603_05625 [Azonexus sp.]|nr:hypothetical protein [Betaproteobacteria bacterium]MBK8917203.1 hypothetical protein [Betaproteobacteria bacterium]MBP6035599.1 hypothetical protein [Azonexus sp.]MBP6906167.1 hypothetical protein [Azonexus sp.]
MIVKYDFRIRTRNGAVVENLSISGRDELEAERKLRQIYQGCEILEAHRRQAALNGRGTVSYEDVMDLITASRA